MPCTIADGDDDPFIHESHLVELTACISDSYSPSSQPRRRRLTTRRTQVIEFSAYISTPCPSESKRPRWCHSTCIVAGGWIATFDLNWVGREKNVLQIVLHIVDRLIPFIHLQTLTMSYPTSVRAGPRGTKSVELICSTYASTTTLLTHSFRSWASPSPRPSLPAQSRRNIFAPDAPGKLQNISFQW